MNARPTKITIETSDINLYRSAVDEIQSRDGTLLSLFGGQYRVTDISSNFEGWLQAQIVLYEVVSQAADCRKFGSFEPKGLKDFSDSEILEEAALRMKAQRQTDDLAKARELRGSIGWPRFARSTADKGLEFIPALAGPTETSMLLERIELYRNVKGVDLAFPIFLEGAVAQKSAQGAWHFIEPAPLASKEESALTPEPSPSRGIVFDYREPKAKPEEPEEAELVCLTCEGGGWECYGIGIGDPHFRECTKCHNPKNRPSP
jgi:hypothetical protein